jgi:hypothetical protein
MLHIHFSWRRMNFDSHRFVLSSNALFTGGCALALVLAARPVERWFFDSGHARPWLGVSLLVVGFGLMAYAVLLVVLSRRRSIAPAWLKLLAAADAAWVVASVLLLALWPQSFTGAGRAALVVVAVFVALFGWMQWRLASHDAMEPRR